MNAAAIVLRVLRNRTGATSAADAVPGALAGLLVVWLAGKMSVELTDVEVGAVIGFAPVASSWLIGTARKVYADLRAWLKLPAEKIRDPYGSIDNASPTDASK